jgi:hypothetical protein
MGKKTALKKVKKDTIWRVHSVSAEKTPRIPQLSS